jgi:TnsA endonuclease N terminal
MSKYHSGIFIPKNPEKYIGKRKIHWRSSWELVFCNFCDQHASVIKWASESISVPYRCPLTGKMKQYIPDFFIQYLDRNGVMHAEVVEIKPLKETGGAKTRSRRDVLISARNQAKWISARAYCEKQGMSFRILTEADLFRMGGNQ